MRSALDRLYAASGALSAAFLVAICVIVLAQVACNAVDAALPLVGRSPIGLVIPSYAEFAGFFLAASSFLALAYTLRAGGHIRVRLLLQRLPAGAQRLAEYWCVCAALFVSAYFAWYCWRLVAESLAYHDMSPGIVPVALWIPQSAMALGLSVLAIAFVDELVGLMRGRRASYAQAEQTEGHGE
jgi:TRAP-type C4-dicarboxylate transport system permease small subunit